MTLVLNGTTGVSSVDGSASTPAIQGADTNTGVFFPAADTVAVATGGSERVRVDSSGNVGINTTSPSSFGKVTLQVDGTTTPTNAANVGPSSINLYAATNGGTTNSTVGVFGWQSNNAGIGSGIGFSRESGSDWGSQIRFYTHPTTTSNINDLTERARITSSGTLLLGRTTDVSNTTRLGLDATASIAGFVSETGPTTSVTHARFNNGNGTVGSISTSGTATTYSTSSDYRLKEDVQPMTGALTRVAALRPVTYKWKVDGTDGEGFIAHELAEVCPDAVVGAKDAVDEEGTPVYQGIDTSFLVATLTAAIQELKAELDALKAQVAGAQA